MRLHIFLMLSGLAGCLAAQTSPKGPTCSVNVAVTPTVRSEGLTELIGDLLLTCTGGTPTPAGQPVPTANITVSLNTGITNRILAGNMTNTLLLIDDPVPANQVLAPYSPTTGQSFTGTLTGNGTGLNFASGATPNVFVGSLGNANLTSWLGIPIDPPGTGSTRTFRITNVRANANGLSYAGPTFPVTAQVSMVSNSPALVFTSQPLLFPFVTVANAQSGLTTSVIPARASHAFPLNYSLAGSNPTFPASPVYSVVQFGENFAPSLLPPATNTALSSTVTTTAGLADWGTRLKAVFSNIPSGVTVFVSTANVNPATGHARSGPLATGSGGPQAQLVSGGTAAGTTGLSQMSLTNGSGTAVWSVTSADAATPDTFSFAVYPVFYSGGTIATAPPAPTNINVALSLTSGTSGPLIAQPTVSPPPTTIFTINSATGLTPQLSATVDSRPCIVGAPYPDPANACSPGNNPQVVVASDSGALTPLFSASTTGGVKIIGTFTSGTTPVDGYLQVTAPGAAAGTYQQTLNFTAPGAANSLQLPYSVTVLPQNNPFIKPSGLVDALSFQSGSIAPGQVFALFGSNFGPASGIVSGAVNASGIVSTTVSNTQVLFDGVAAPLLYVANNQLSGVAPFELKGKTSTQVQVVYNNVKSPATTVPVAAASLSIASADGSGGGGGVVINADGSLNSASHPASVGDQIVIYAAYAGPFANGVTGTDGRTTTSAPYPVPAGTVSVTIGGVAATTIPYFGNAPTLLESVMQINVVIPPGVKSGASIPLSIAAGSATSSGYTTIAVK